MVSNIKTTFVCQTCGYGSSKWLGKCPECNAWNTFTEEIVKQEKKKSSARAQASVKKPIALNNVKSSDELIRLSSGILELDRVLGGGVVRGEIALIAGEPGIGKSTLLLQMADSLAKSNKVLYISGEESAGQIKLRADRLNLKNTGFNILNETDILTIRETVEQDKPEVLIIDSVQTMSHPEMSGTAGSAGQVRETTAVLIALAKEMEIPVFLIGHITKEGSIAGPKVLEHMVDCVLYFEGERNGSFRILRTIKNRFGSTDEIGVFEMRDTGLAEINNPADYFLEGSDKNTVGTALSVILEGSRCLVIEVQALSVFSPMIMPRRVAAGIDLNKLSLLAAVLEKVGGINLRNQEIYLKLAGGIRVTEPAIDLGCAMAMVSSFRNKAIPTGTILIGEVGLNGNIRSVSRLGQRIREARKLGFTKAVIPVTDISDSDREGMTFLNASHISEAIEKLFS